MTLEFSFVSAPAAEADTDVVVVPVFESGALPPAAASIDAASGGALRRLLDAGDASGKLGQVARLFALPGVKAPRVLLVGLGRVHARIGGGDDDRIGRVPPDDLGEVLRPTKIRGLTVEKGRRHPRMPFRPRQLAGELARGAEHQHAPRHLRQALTAAGALRAPSLSPA